MRTRRQRLIAAHNGIRARLGAERLPEKIDPRNVRATAWSELVGTVEQLRSDVDHNRGFEHLVSRLREG